MNHDYWGLSNLPLVVAFAIVGAVIASSRPNNAVGWLFLFASLVIGELIAARGYATHALVEVPGGLPGGDLAAWLGVWPVELTLAPIALALLLFPDGSPPSRRWGVVVWVIVACSLVQALLSFGWDVNVTRAGNFPQAQFPFSLPGVAIASPLFSFLQNVNLFVTVVVLIGMGLRYRRGTLQERRQMKWILYSVVLVGLGLLTPIWVSGEETVIPFTILAPLIPISAGVAILRHNLYDIDRIISRTLAYAIVTAVLAGLYVGLVLLASVVSPLSTDSPFVVAISTLVIAGAFGPARRRVQSLVDRRFNRASYSASITMQEFASRLRDEVDIQMLTRDLLGVVNSSFQPRAAGLWLRDPDGSNPSARTGG
jgi:hypothetical protein